MGGGKGSGEKGTAGAGGAPRVSIARLPATAPVLFGREADLAWLDTAWKEGAHVATVVAWGGVGKTALVNRWLAEVRDRGWDGAERVFAWSFCSQGTERLSSSDPFVEAALSWFGDPDPSLGLAWERGERLAGLVRERKTILVLDGVEPLPWGPGVEPGKLKEHALQALLKELAAQNEGLCVVTSRIRLADLDGLSGEKVRAKDLGSLSAEAGARLLEARGAKGAEEELRRASEEYEGHALALTLLGSYLAEVANGDIRCRKEIGPLEEGEEHGEHARRVMRSYAALLGEPEVAILHMIGLFDRPADDDEIAALRADPTVPGLTDALAGIGERGWNKAVAKLREVGLLSADEDERLGAHPLVREHFGAQLRREQPDAWREGHRRLYEHLKGKAKEYPETIEEMAPLYAAVVHGCLAGKNQEALDEVFRKRIYRGKEGFNGRKLGAFGSELAVLSAFFDPPWERLAPGLGEPAQAFVLNQAGFALRALGRLSEAAGLMRLGLARCIAQEDWTQAASSASNLSNLRLTHGELSEAEAQAQKSVELADRSGDALQRVARRTTVAAIQYARGLRAEAAASFEEAERMLEEMQPDYPRLYSLQGFQYCDLLLDQGRDADVRERAAQTLEWAQAHLGLLDVALDHISLGRAHLLGAQRGTGGDLALAGSHFQQAVDGLRRAGTQHHLPLGLLARAALHLHTGKLDLAHRDLDDALSLSTRCEFRLHECDAHLGLARLALAERDPARARAHLDKARALITKTGYHRRDEELSELLQACAEEEEKERRGAEAQRREKAVEERASQDEAAGEQGRGEALAPLRLGASAFSSASGSTPAETRTSPAEPMNPAFPFPQPLLDAYRDHRLAILFGSGLSMAPDVQPRFPRWNELPDRLLDEVARQSAWTPKQIQLKRDFFKEGYVSLESMLTELDALKTALRSVRKYRAALTSIFMPVSPAPGDVHRALVDLGVQVLLTTNYDELLEAVEGPPARRAYTWRESERALEDIEEGRKVLFKIHGTADDDESVVMTVREYDKAAAHVPYQRTMSYLLARYTFLLVGYGINDPLDLDMVFSLNAGAFGVAAKTHYALMHRSVSATDRDRWQRTMNIQTVPYDDHGDLPAILRALAKHPRNPP
jgi:tetratricopeptide (TPR) repeat protein